MPGAVAQRLLGLLLRRLISEDQHHAGDVAGSIFDWRTAVGDRGFAPVFGNQQGVIGQSYDFSFRQNFMRRIFDRIPGLFIDDFENLFQRPARGLRLTPARQRFRHGIHPYNAAVQVG